MLCLSAHDTALKLLLGMMPWTEALALRSFVLAGLCFAWCASRNEFGILSIAANPREHLLRIGTMVAAGWCYAWGLASLPLPVVVTLSMTGPLFVALLSPALLGEQPAVRTWIGMAAALAGVALVVFAVSDRASPLETLTAVTGVAVAAPVMAALFGAMRDIGARRLRSAGHPLSLVFWPGLALGGSAALAASLGFRPAGIDAAWSYPDHDTVTITIVVCGTLGLFAHLLSVRAFALAPAGPIASLRYLTVATGLLFGWIFWDHIPNLPAALGMALILSGVALAVAKRTSLVAAKTPRMPSA